MVCHESKRFLSIYVVVVSEYSYTYGSGIVTWHSYFWKPISWLGF